MGIHNSSELSTERRVVDHPFKSNMKAFMTACAVLASSANADSQVFPNVVNHHPSMVSPYNVVPLSQGAYTNVVSYGMTQPLTPVTRPLTTYGMGPLATYGMTTYGMDPTFGPHFVKREAESAYIIQTRMDNPMAGSQQEVQIKVDELGNGKSFQHVEQTDERNVMRDNYMLEHRGMAQRPFVSNRYMLAQMAMDRTNRMGMDQIQRNNMGMNTMYSDRKVMDMGPNVGLVYNEDKRQKVADILDSLNNDDSETISKLEKVIQQAQGLWEMAYNGFHGKAENLKEAKANHNEMTKNLKETFEYHNKLGENLKDAIELVKSAKEGNILPKRRQDYSKNNMRYENMLVNNNQMTHYNMMEDQMIYPQNQIIRTQHMRI